MDKVTFRTRMRALQTILGISKRGFFIPYRHAAAALRDPPPYPAFEALFDGCREAFARVLGAIRDGADDMQAAWAGPLAAHRGSGYFGRLDAAAAFAMVGKHAPQRIVEVGSGTSTHVLQAAGQGLASPPAITCIDPIPRSEIGGLGVEFLAEVLADRHAKHFAELEPGDIAFFDSSHVMLQGTDVDIIANRLLPALKPGVIVHVHDVFLPDPYPPDWVIREYSEQLALGGWLLGDRLVPLFSSHYAATRMPDETAAAVDLPPHALHSTSLWLERT